MAKKTEIGQLRQIVKVERNEPTQLGAGMKDHYVEFLTTRGRLRNLGGNRALSFGEANIEDRWELIVRFQVLLENDVNKSMRFVINNMIFTINTFYLIDEKRRYYRFLLNEKK